MTNLDFPLTAIGAAAAWWLPNALLGRRLRATPSLDHFSATPPAADGAARVSIILPARNEAAHITACVQAMARSTWPNLELIVIDDHSTDGNGDLARGNAHQNVQLRGRSKAARSPPATAKDEAARGSVKRTLATAGA